MGGQRRFRPVRALGQGAGGEVLLVQDRLQGDRLVALKRLAVDDEASRAALEREFSTLASLSLPGVARVFDFGVSDDPALGASGAFFTRAFVEGRSLDSFVGEDELRVRVSLFDRVAARVQKLHAAGVVHGDLKPANAIIDNEGRAHLIDFGLSRGLGIRTDHGAVGGTPAFMAPELFTGEAPSVLTDVYALGATLWMLIAGALPSAKPTKRADAKGKGERPALPLGLDANTEASLRVAQRCLANDASQRFPTVGELRSALARVFPAESNDDAHWVAPRARGHEGFAATLREIVTTSGRLGGSVLVAGASGTGKTTLLRLIKWHCQLRGWPVLEVAVGRGEGLAPADAMLNQVHLLNGSDAPSSAGSAAEPWAETLVRELAQIDSHQPILVLVDDIDHAERVLGERLRDAVHNERGVPVVVVASARDERSAAVVELSPTKKLEMPPLDDEVVRTLALDALGAIDESVIAALCDRCRGVPGLLIPMLRTLAAQTAPTAADVARLDPDGLAKIRAQQQASALSEVERRVVVIVQLFDGRVTQMAVGTWLGIGADALGRTIEQLVDRGVLRREHERLAIEDVVVAVNVRERVGHAECCRLAAAWLARSADVELDEVSRARLALAANDLTQVNVWVAAAIDSLRACRAYLAAIDLARDWSALTDEQERTNVLALLAELQHDAGMLDDAAATARTLLAIATASPQQHAQASVLIARCLSSHGQFDEALEVLTQVPERASAASLARGFRERAKIHLLRGNYDLVVTDGQRGLDVAEATDLVRVELLTSMGMAASYLGDQSGARQRYEEALALSRQAGSKRDIANALAYLAISSRRSGDVMQARDLFAESLVIARELGDVGGMANFSLNVGAMEFYLGRVGVASEHYLSAIHLAQRAGRASTGLQARNNLAHIHIYFGLFEQARAEAESVVADASAAGLRLIQAQATVLVADLHAREGDVDGALVRYEEGQRVYADLGQAREVADVHLDAAEAILDRGGPADPSAAATRLAAARALITEHDLSDFQLRLALLVCRAWVGAGDLEQASTELPRIIARAQQEHARDVLWTAHMTSADVHQGLGAAFRARRCEQEAIEVLEEIALQVPREHREAFWNDPRRREVRRRAVLMSPDASGATVVGDMRRDRLLEIIKRLASEHDLDRLLDRITESAVELSGAERGFVLLVDASGKLEMRAERSTDDKRVDPHAAFSRSVAEAVLIDGEPIVTVDAGSDQRVNEYLSVHRLMLRSLACLPIRGRRGVVGVLYLEHRRHRGRFSDADIDVIHALADQAAIALENARLMADEAARRVELEAANQALEAAKREIESLLIARTEELEQARIALEEARVTQPLEPNRYGMIGRSAGMRRVFETIGRLATNDIPVGIFGESGTGKELVARAIHTGGTRAAAPFVVVNCAAIPEALIESELFGHVRGAFTGADRDKLGLVAKANGGTLFLDEISEMPPKMQVDFLRVIQERSIRPVGSEHDLPIDVRFVTASNRALEDMIESKEFREDLFYRLNVVQLRIPPLRERRDDIPILCEHFLRTFARRDGKALKRLSPDAMDRLCAHPLPGNVRQLEHLLLNAWVLVDGSTIRGDHLALERGSAPPTVSQVDDTAVDSVPPANVEEHREHERRKILESLERHAWNRVQAAAALGMPRRTFYRRLRDYSII